MKAENDKYKVWVFDKIQLTLELSEPVTMKEAVAMLTEKFESVGFSIMISDRPRPKFEQADLLKEVIE